MLTVKQKLFVECYLETRNGVEAARRAGYKGNYSTLGQVAYENLKKPDIASEIDTRLKPFILSANETLSLLSLHAYGSVEWMLNDTHQLDLDKAKANGSIRLIKKIRYHKETGMVESVELHDPQSAAVHLGKYHKLFTDKVESTKPELSDEDVVRISSQLESAFGQARERKLRLVG